MMIKVRGIGGIFFKAKDPGQLCQWYKEVLGFELDGTFDGCIFKTENMPESGYSVWAPFPQDTEYLQPSEKDFMINLIVDDVQAALKQVEEGGGKIIDTPQEIEFGTFGWFMDPDGNKIELWSPK